MDTLEAPTIRLPLPAATDALYRSLLECADAANAAAAARALENAATAVPPVGAPAIAAAAMCGSSSAGGSPGEQRLRFTPQFAAGKRLGVGSYGVVELCHERYTITPRGTKIYACQSDTAGDGGANQGPPRVNLTAGCDDASACLPGFGTFACKTVHKTECDNNEPQDPRVALSGRVAALWREIKVMKHLGKHLNIVEIKGAYNNDERLRLVMELCDSGDLLTLLKGKRYGVAHLRRMQQQQQEQEQQEQQERHLSKERHQAMQRQQNQKQHEQQQQQKQRQSGWAQTISRTLQVLSSPHKQQHQHMFKNDNYNASSSTSNAIAGNTVTKALLLNMMDAGSCASAATAANSNSGAAARDHYDVDHDGLPEPLAAGIFRQLVAAVAHCHAHGVIHLDIKLENVPLASHQQQVTRSASDSAVTDSLNRYTDPTVGAVDATSPFIVKLADFGLAKLLKPPETHAIGDMGSKLYKAPEVYERRRYTTQADMWSLGVVLYELLSASFPETDPKTGMLVPTSPENLFKHQLWRTVSDDAMDLVLLLLSYDPDVRPTCEMVLRHAWVQQGESFERIQAEGVDPAKDQTGGAAVSRGKEVASASCSSNTAPAASPSISPPTPKPARISPRIPPPPDAIGFDHTHSVWLARLPHTGVTPVGEISLPVGAAGMAVRGYEQGKGGISDPLLRQQQLQQQTTIEPLGIPSHSFPRDSRVPFFPKGTPTPARSPATVLRPETTLVGNGCDASSRNGGDDRPLKPKILPLLRLVGFSSKPAPAARKM